MEISLFWIGAGLAALGYFIGDGLKNFKNPKASSSEYPTLIKESDLHHYLGLKKDEVDELLSKYPDAPKVELRGTRYYPYQPFLEWMSSDKIYK
ncbi:DNA-binding protein [Cytobacillus sp. FJAT-54145]|uniref:DNA-binding protein n=1 Tax=Cytobacillus spartinae TaxID=3299023 RepID=A0ABW6KAL9_9BACI